MSYEEANDVISKQLIAEHAFGIKTVRYICKSCKQHTGCIMQDRFKDSITECNFYEQEATDDRD